MKRQAKTCDSAGRKDGTNMGAALRVRGEVCFECGNVSDALVHLNQAIQHLEGGAARELARVYRTLARVVHDEDDEMARDYAELAAASSKRGAGTSRRRAMGFFWLWYFRRWRSAPSRRRLFNGCRLGNTQTSDAIVVARVESVASNFDEKSKSVRTRIKLDVTEPLKGVAAGPLWLVQIGGVVEERGSH